MALQARKPKKLVKRKNSKKHLRYAVLILAAIYVVSLWYILQRAQISPQTPVFFFTESPRTHPKSIQHQILQSQKDEQAEIIARFENMDDKSMDIEEEEVMLNDAESSKAHPSEEKEKKEEKLESLGAAASAQAPVQKDISQITASLPINSAIESKKSKDNLKAVLVVGPRSTGVQTLKAMVSTATKELEMDNYFKPQFSKTFAHCFLKSSTRDTSCAEVLLGAKNKKNILIAVESFSIPGIEMEALTKYLESWNDVTIVIYYRRFYDWLLAQYKAIAMGYGMESEKRPTIIKMLSDKRFISSSLSQYSTAMSHRYREYFSNVVVINMADADLDHIKKTFCKAMNAENSCQKAKKTQIVSKEIPYELFYREILHEAKKEGMIDFKTNEEFENMVIKAQEFHEGELKGEVYHFELKCPPQSVLDHILEESLRAEQELFPGFFASPKGEPTLRTDFKKQASSKFCVLSPKDTILKNSWTRFLNQLKV